MTDPTTSPPRTSLGRRLLVAASAMLLLGIVAGLVWIQVAQPAEWEARDGGLVLTEGAAQGQFSVVVMFVLIGVGASVVWAWGATWSFPDLGWLLIPLVLLMTVLAALLAWRIGVELGPPPPGSVSGVSVGDRVPSQLAVDGVAPFLAWPIFGLIGVIGATWAGAARSDRDSVRD